MFYFAIFMILKIVFKECSIDITDDDTVENDIALIRVGGGGFDMSENSDIITVCLPEGPFDDKFLQNECFVSGWGATSK